MGFDDYATDNLWRLLDDQRSATGAVPTDTTLLVERFRDELGDWRVILHSPYGLAGARPAGAGGGAAAARALRHRREADRLRRRHRRAAARHRRDAAPRAPSCSSSTPTRSTRSSPPRWAVRRCSRRGSANARPAPCCCRAATPGKRSPLWHQRQRAAQLLDVARKYPDFPIVLETVRECLQDVYDVPTLTELMARIAQRRVRVVEVETADAVAVRGVAAVRLRRRVHVRGRQPAGRAPRRRAVAGQHAAGRAAGPRRTARAARPRGRRRHRPRSCSTSPPTAPPATPRASPTCCGCSAR